MNEITVFEEKHKLYQIASAANEYLTYVRGASAETKLGESIKAEALKGLLDCGFYGEEEVNAEKTRTIVNINGDDFSYDIATPLSKDLFMFANAFMDEMEIDVFNGDKKEATLHIIAIPFDTAYGKYNQTSCPIFFLIENNGKWKYFTCTKEEDGNLIEFKAFNYSFEIAGGFWDGKYATEIAILNDGYDLEVSVAPYRSSMESDGHILLEVEQKVLHIMPIPQELFEYRTPAALICIDNNGYRKVFFKEQPDENIEIFLGNNQSLVLSGSFDENMCYNFTVKNNTRN